MSSRSRIETALGLELQEQKTSLRKTSPLDEKQQDESLRTLLETVTEDDDEHKMPCFGNNNWRVLALNVSLVSFFVILVLGVAALVASEVSDSSAELAFAFDALLGLASSSCMMWRFYRKNLAPCEIPSKEKKACLFIAVGFMLSAVVMFARAVYCLGLKIKPLETVTIIIISTLGFLCYALLFFVKFKVAHNLHSVAMRTDSYDSACGAVMALGVLVSTIIYKHAPTTWWIDPVIALVIAMVTFIYGVIVLRKVILDKGFGEPEEYQQF